MDVNWTYCDDHFSVFASIESLCCMPETNILHVNYILKNDNGCNKKDK